MDCCELKEAIKIVKGNDTGWNGQTFLTIYFNNPVFDLATSKATFTLGGIVKTFDDISGGSISINYTAAETNTFPYGVQYGVLNIITDGEIATIESLIPFNVVGVVHGDAIATEPYTLNFDVKQGDETVLNVSVEAGVSVEVGTTTTLPAGSSATVTNSGTENHLVLDFGIPQGEDGEKGEDGKDAKINGVNTLTLTTGDGLSLEQDGNTATIDLDSSVLLNYSDDDESIAIGGESSTSGGYAAAIGFGASAGMDGLAVGHYAKATDEAIQIGGGINNDSGTVQVLSYKLLDSSGIIPDARISSNIARTSAFVPKTRTVNGKELSSDISLTYTDVGAQVAGNYMTTDTQQEVTGKKLYRDKTLQVGRASDYVEKFFWGTEDYFYLTAQVKDNINVKAQLGLYAVDEDGDTESGFVVAADVFVATYVGRFTVPTPTDDNTTSKQADTVGARNTKLANYELKSKPLNTLATSGTISPDTNTRNVVAPTGAITLSLPATPDTTIVNDIELQVNQTSTVGFNFGSVLWGEDGAPDMSVGIWDFIFSYIAGHWVGSYKKWETS